MKSSLAFTLLMIAAAPYAHAFESPAELECKRAAGLAEIKLFPLGIPAKGAILKIAVSDLTTGADEVQSFKMDSVGFEGTVFQGATADQRHTFFYSPGGGSTLTRNGIEYRCRILYTRSWNEVDAQSSGIAVSGALLARSPGGSTFSFALKNQEPGTELGAITGGCSVDGQLAPLTRHEFKVSPQRYSDGRVDYLVALTGTLKAGDFCKLNARIISAGTKTTQDSFSIRLNVTP